MTTEQVMSREERVRWCIARALCATCDGIGIVGDDDPGRYPTPCPVCSEEDAA